MRLVTTGMAGPRATRRYSRGRLGHVTPKQILLGPNRAMSKTDLMGNGLTTPRLAVTTIVAASSASCPRYGRKISTMRWNVPRGSLGLATSPSGPRGARERAIISGTRCLVAIFSLPRGDPGFSPYPRGTPGFLPTPGGPRVFSLPQGDPGI